MGAIIAFWLSGWGAATTPAESTHAFDAGGMSESSAAATTLAAAGASVALAAGGSSSLASFDRTGSL